MKKIMFVIGSLSGGGAERVVTTVASFLAETKKYDVSILTYYKDDKEYPFSLNIKRINISGGDKKNYNKLNFFHKVIKIRKEVLKYGPDHIVCFLAHPVVFTYFSLLFSRFIKKIIYAERANPKYGKSRICKTRDFIVKKIKKIITQNSGQVSCFDDKKQNIKIIPNPMYKELFENEKEYALIPKKIVSVGRLTSQKNFELGIKAFYEVQKRYKDIEYYIYGEGNKKQDLIDLITSLGLDGKVHLMGFEKDRNVIYGDKDIYLMTSRFEGMPNTLAEAMCYGIPSISTDCDFGPSDLIMNEEMGILLKDDLVDTVASGIFKMIDNYGEYVNYAKNSRKILNENYSYEKIMNEWENYFEVEEND